MSKPILESTTLSDYQRAVIQMKYRNTQQWYNYYDEAVLPEESNFHRGFLDALEYLFGKEFFNKRANEK